MLTEIELNELIMIMSGHWIFKMNNHDIKRSPMKMLMYTKMDRQCMAPLPLAHTLNL